MDQCARIATEVHPIDPFVLGAERAAGAHPPLDPPVTNASYTDPESLDESAPILHDPIDFVHSDLALAAGCIPHGESGMIKHLYCSDPQVVSFIREYVEPESGLLRAVIGCVNLGDSDTVVGVQVDFLSVTAHEFLAETFVAGSRPGISTPWPVMELNGSTLEFAVPRYGSAFRLFKSIDPQLQSKEFAAHLLVSSVKRSGKFAKNEITAAVAATDCYRLQSILARLIRGAVTPNAALLSDLVRVGGLDSDGVARLVAKLKNLSLSSEPISSAIMDSWNIGPILFTTPELGKWSTYGGLGVMVDDLTCTLGTIAGTSLDAEPVVWVCSPYYERNRKGESGYLAKDNIAWSFNIHVNIGIDTVTVGVYEGVIGNVRYFFLHNAMYFPSIYPDNLSSTMKTAFLALMAKCPLEICCKLGRIPRTIVTNDWATGLTAAYAKMGYFGSVFANTEFMHTVHNLDISYEGRMFPDPHEDVGKVHMLPTDMLVDPYWAGVCVNPSRCALMASDNWGTVSLSYRRELLEGSPLSPLLRRFSDPFAHPNGIPVEQRLQRIKATGFGSHWDAKAALQRKYFGAEDESRVLIAFVGRITYQKGIHLILDIAESLLETHSDRVQILIGGAVNAGEEYAVHCGRRMKDLNSRFASNFWSDPDSFFADGPLVNLGADFGLMPSAFEPGGIVQQEFMVAGTPVIAFKTGGLRDTISEYYEGAGNGFTFESHTGPDLMAAIERAVHLFWTDRADYEHLRQCAVKSVITCEMVAVAWLKEFYRMHGSEYADASVVTAELASVEPYTAPTPTEEEVEEAEDCSSTTEWCSDEEGVSTHAPSPRSIVSRTMSRDSSLASLFLRPRSVRLSFSPNVGRLPRTVLLAGSFDRWASRVSLEWADHTGTFDVDLCLPQGTWHVKLIVDGSWTCIEDYPTETDSAGNVNNVILVD